MDNITASISRSHLPVTNVTCPVVEINTHYTWDITGNAVQSNLFALWKWPHKAGELKLEVVFVIIYYILTVWPSGLKNERVGCHCCMGLGSTVLKTLPILFVKMWRRLWGWSQCYLGLLSEYVTLLVIVDAGALPGRLQGVHLTLQLVDVRFGSDHFHFLHLPFFLFFWWKKIIFSFEVEISSTCICMSETWH